MESNIDSKIPEISISTLSLEDIGYKGELNEDAQNSRSSVGGLKGGRPKDGQDSQPKPAGAPRDIARKRASGKSKG
jgi:hypothetical protein